MATTKTNKTFSKGKVTTKTVEAKEPVAPIPAQPIVKPTPIIPAPEETAKKEPVSKLTGTAEANTVKSATFSNGGMKINYEK